MLDLLPTALMAFAALAWLRAGTTRDRDFDVELLLGCLMLNAAALVLWNALHGPKEMLAHWAPQAAAAGVFNLFVHGARHLFRSPIGVPRAAWPAGAFAVVAGLILVVASPAHAQEQPEDPAEPIEMIPVDRDAHNEHLPPAEEDTTELEPVVVVGTRTPRAASEVAGSVSVVSGEQIEYRQASSIGEALRDLPGVSIEGGPRANAEFVNVRGLSGPRVLTIVDGARQNFLGGHRSNLLLDPDLLKQVELLRGPASALWGSDALGGVIVFTTRDASDFLADGERLAARLRTGFEGVSGERLGSGIGAAELGSFEFVGSFTQRDSDDYELGAGGTEPHTALDTQAGLAKLAWRPDGSPHSVSLTQQSFRQSGESPSNPATDVSDTNPLIDRTNDDAYTILRYAFASDADSWVRAGQLNVYRDALTLREDRVGEPRADRTHFATNGASGHITIPSGWGFGHESLFTLGGEYFRDSARATRNGEPRPQYPDSERNLGGAFLQSELALGDWSVTPGVRYDVYRAESNTGAGRAMDESALSPKLGLVYRVLPNLTLRAGYNSAFRAPGLVEIYAAGQHFLGNNFVPNPELRPEKARNLEIGFTLDVPGFGEGQQALISASAYRNKVRDFIELYVEATTEVGAPQCAPPSPAVGCVNRNDDGTLNPLAPPIFIGGTTSSRNLDGATLTGGELEASYLWGPFKLGASYSSVRGSADNDGMPLVSIPADRIRSTVDVSLFNGVKTTVGYTRAFTQGRVPTLDDGTAAVPATSGYETWDWSASWSPNVSFFGLKEPRLVLGVDNLTDAEYRDHLNVLSSPGRNVRASMSTGF